MDLKQCRNLGPKSAAMLERAGIRTRDDLQRMGSVAAYLHVGQSGAKVSLNLLWALEGALTDRVWQDVAKEDRLNLLLQLETLENKSRHSATTKA